MKAATLAFLGAALSIALPAASQAQNYYGPNTGGGRSLNIPLPNFGNRQNDQQNYGNQPNDRYQNEQQAQLGSDRSRYCEDLRRQANDLRYDVNRARDREDFARTQDRLRDTNARLARNCE